MFAKEYSENLKIPSSIFSQFSSTDMVYFDIETTGFDKEKDNVILISLGYFEGDGKFKIEQFFSEGPEEEAVVLNEFKKFLKPFKCWCSYNGLAFDEPFIKRRMEINGILFSSPEIHIDLYRKIKPYQVQLGMKRCNLKSVEKFIGIDRKDQIDGSISVELYEKYLISKDSNIKKVIMLHNYEDVLSLPEIYKLVNKVENNSSIPRDNCITEKQLKFLKCLIKENNLKTRWNYEKLSKKTASKLIDNILKGNLDMDELNLLIINS